MSAKFHGLRLLDYARLKPLNKYFDYVPPPEHILQSRAGWRYYNEDEHKLEVACVLALQFLWSQRTGKNAENLRRLRRLVRFDLDQEWRLFREWKWSAKLRASPCQKTPDLSKTLQIEDQRTTGAVLSVHVRQKGDATMKSGEELQANDREVGIVQKTLESHNYTVQMLDAWLASVEAETMSKALAAMQAYRYPQFLLIYTLNRRCNHQTEAYNAINLYFREFPHSKPQYQVELTYLALKIAMRYVIEMVMPICQMFTELADKTAKTPKAYNELLWQIAGMGTDWGTSSSTALAAGQEILLKSSGPGGIDRKGFVALAYLEYKNNPDLARKLASAGDISSGMLDFPYIFGKHAINILTSTTTDEALFHFHKARQIAEKSLIWVLLLQTLRDHRLLTDYLARKLWLEAQKSRVRLTSRMIELFVEAFDDYYYRVEMLCAVERSGFKINDRVLACLGRVTEDEFDDYRSYLALYPQYKNSKHVLNALLDAEANYNHEAAWFTYRRLVEVYGVNTGSLEALCRAARPQLIWDGQYATRRAVNEVKAHIRTDSTEVVKLYPSQRLIYNYIVMLGRAHYDPELIELLGWLHSINFSPEKRVLCALIYYSPQGPNLLQLGAKARDEGASNWPTKEEFQSWKTQFVSAQ